MSEDLAVFMAACSPRWPASSSCLFPTDSAEFGARCPGGGGQRQELAAVSRASDLCGTTPVRSDSQAASGMVVPSGRLMCQFPLTSRHVR